MSKSTVESDNFTEELNRVSEPLVKAFEIGAFLIPIAVIVYQIYQMWGA